MIDRGIGITRREQSKIFEKFYRTGDPLVHNTRGSGLGLSLVRHVTHAHGGEGGSGKHPGERQQVHSVVAAGSGHAAADEWHSIRGDGIMKTKKNLTGRPNGGATDSRSGTAKPTHRSALKEA